MRLGGEAGKQSGAGEGSVRGLQGEEASHGMEVGARVEGGFSDAIRTRRGRLPVQRIWTSGALIAAANKAVECGGPEGMSTHEVAALTVDGGGARGEPQAGGSRPTGCIG